MNYISLLSIVLMLQVNWGYAAPDLSLREKIGQMLIFGFDGTSVTANSPIVKSIQTNNLGGVILFDFNFRKKNFDKNIRSPEQVKKLNEDLQHFAQLGNHQHHRPNLALLIGIDYEGGEVSRLTEKYGFPKTYSAFTLAHKGYADAKDQAAIMARTLAQSGFNLDFAPDLDVLVNPLNPIIAQKERSFSSDPEEVASYAKIFSQEFHAQQIHCVYKHFPGHGSSSQDSHLGFVDVTKTWKPEELIPYKILINKPWSCGIIMSAHLVNRKLDPSGLPATLSHKILTDLLRNQLHFKGVIITDDLQMKAISANFTLDEALVKSINAGADMLIFGNNLDKVAEDPAEVISLIEKKVKSGEIKEERINDAYSHIKLLKISY